MKSLFCLHILLLLPLGLCAQSALDTLVQTERAFAKMADETSIQEAFLHYLDSSGLVFEDAIPANGIEKYSKETVNKKISLRWYPAVAAISSDGQLGYTAGPFTFAPTRTAAPIIYGYYFTVWKKDVQQTFKLLADGGTYLGAKAPSVLPAELTSAPVHAPTGTPATADDSFNKAVLAFTNALQKSGHAAYAEFLATKPYLARNGKLPAYDRTAALQLADSSAYLQTAVTGETIAASNDIAWCYGTLTSQAAAAKKGFFSQLWIHENDHWKILAEVVSF